MQARQFSTIDTELCYAYMLYFCVWWHDFIYRLQIVNYDKFIMGQQCDKEVLSILNWESIGISADLYQEVKCIGCIKKYVWQIYRVCQIGPLVSSLWASSVARTGSVNSGLGINRLSAELCNCTECIRNMGVSD